MELLSSFSQKVKSVNLGLPGRAFLVPQNECCVAELENGENVILQNGKAGSTGSR
jgi:hypothetical protein